MMPARSGEIEMMPARSSPIWQVFTRVTDEHGKPDAYKAKCNYCRPDMVFETRDGNTVSWKHFKRFHPHESHVIYRAARPPQKQQQQQPPAPPSRRAARRPPQKQRQRPPAPPSTPPRLQPKVVADADDDDNEGGGDDVPALSAGSSASSVAIDADADGRCRYGKKKRARTETTHFHVAANDELVGVHAECSELVSRPWKEPLEEILNARVSSLSWQQPEVLEAYHGRHAAATEAQSELDPPGPGGVGAGQQAGGLQLPLQIHDQQHTTMSGKCPGGGS